MPRMPKYLKREWAFFLDELELSAEDAFSASAPRMGRKSRTGRPAYLIEVLREVKGGKPLPTTSLQRS